MRILHVCAYTWAIGGPAKMIYDHAQVAVAQGHQVDILSPVSPTDTLYPAPAGCRVIPCRRTPVISRFFNEFSLDLDGFLRQHSHEYDIIHCHGIWHFASIDPFLVNRTVPKVVTIHGLLDPWALRQGRWKKQLMSTLIQKRLLHRADLIHVLNADEKRDTEAYLGHPHPPILQLPNGIRPADFARLPARGTFRQAFGLPADKRLILFMSRLNRKKGLDLLLPAFAQYHRQQPDAVLVLAGPDYGYQATAEAFIREHNLTDAVRLVGMLTGDHKLAALADADVFVLPSYSEGFSMAVLEAMASGVATLLSDRVGFADDIRAHDAGVIAGLSAAGVAAGLHRLLHDDTYRRGVGERARALVQQDYDIDRIAGRLLDHYQTLLNR